MLHPDQAQPEGDAFWRRFCPPVEDREREMPTKGYRWFRSENVVAIEHFRGRLWQPGQKAGKYGKITRVVIGQL